MKILERVYFKQAINETASDVILPTYTLPPTETTTSTVIVTTSLSIENQTSPFSETIDSEDIQSWIDILLVVSYSLLLMIGIIGNISVLVTTCRKGSAKHQPQRYSLILSLALADLLIILVCYPSAVLLLMMPYFVVPIPICHAIATVQSALHAISNFSMAFLAFDRYLTLRKPKTASKLANWASLWLFMLWSLSCLIALPIMFIQPNMDHPELATGLPMCSDRLPWNPLYIAYYTANAVSVYILPGTVVWICNMQVGASLQQRRLEEMKLQTKPRQTIIIAKDCTVVGANKHKVVADDSSINGSDMGSDADFYFSKPDPISAKNTSKSLNTPKVKAPVGPSKSMKTIIRAHRRLRVRKKFNPTSIFAEPKPQSVETRLKLAKLLRVLVWVFTICWAPFTIAKLAWPFLPPPVVHTVLSVTLMVGQSHSALSPIIYWLMNRSIISSLRQWMLSRVQWPPTKDSFSCSCCGLSKCLSRPEPTPWVNNSSTNEYALGAFHPKYVNPLMLRPQPSRCTSHYFH